MQGLLDFLQGASNSAASNVSAPVDGLAWLLRKAGLPIPANPVGGSDWMAEKGLTAQPKNRNMGLLGEAIGGVAPIVAAAKAPQIAKGLLALDDKAMDVTRRGIEGYMDSTGMRQNIFIGPNAKTWDKAAANKAQELADAGTDARKIWSETGTWKGPDGKWRQEIPDNVSALQDSKIPAPKSQIELANWYLHDQGIPTKYDIGSADSLVSPMLKDEALQWANHAHGMQKTPSTPLASVFHHENLYGAYPEFSYSPITKETGGRLRGSFNEKTGAITTGGGVIGDTVGPRSTTLHELQHAIQQKEGWARGGAPEDKYLDGPAKTFFDNNVSEFIGDPKQLMSMARDRAYRNLAGEAEARATQARIPLDAAQRRALFPEDSYDVPMNQLIIRGLL
jgi:hypothetical protein